MKELKRIICGIMAVLMLADAAVGVSCTAYAEESAPEEQEAILHMESVKGEDSVDVPLTAELQEEVDLQGDQELEDTAVPELDVSSLHMEYDAKLGGKATLTYQVTNASEVAHCSAWVVAVTSGGIIGNELRQSSGGLDATGNARSEFALTFYGVYQVQSIYVSDVRGKSVCYYNSACSSYRGETPAVDMSAVDFVLQPPVEDATAPVIDLGSIQLEMTELKPNEGNTLYVNVKDDSVIVDIKARFMRETGQELNCEVSEFSTSDNGQYTLPIREDILGVWQLFSISATDACGNTTNFINSSHPKYSSIYGTENLYDLSSIVFEVKTDSFATPEIDLASVAVSTSIAYNCEQVKISMKVDNPDSVLQMYGNYRVTGAAGKQNDSINLHYYGTKQEESNSGEFVGWLTPSYFGEYEAEWIELLDYSGEWQTIYNSALTYSWTLPEDAILYDLSALNFSSIDAQIYTMEDLKTTLAAAEDGDKLQIAASEDFAVTEDITIPKGVYLNVQSGSGSFKVAKGVTFTTEARFNCYVPMTVAGTWVNKSNSTCHNGLTITSSGTLENSGTIEVYGDYIPNGTIIESAGHHIRVNYTVSTMEELLAAIDKVKTADSITIESSDEAFVIDQSVTIPNGVRLSAERAITIGKGVTFTTIGGFDCYAPLTVDGTWKCSGHSYCYGGLSITSTGCVENNSNLYIYDSYDNQGTLIADFNWSTRLILRVSGKQTLKEDMTLSENLSLYIYGQTSDAALTVSEGVSLTTMGEFYCYIPLTVAGTWVNEGGSTCNSGLTITPTGTVDNARGWIHLNGALNNEGALTNSSGVYQTNTASSPEELTLAIEHTLTGGTIRVSGDGGDFVINKEMTIPAGITVEVWEKSVALHRCISP